MSHFALPLGQKTPSKELLLENFKRWHNDKVNLKIQADAELQMMGAEMLVHFYDFVPTIEEVAKQESPNKKLEIAIQEAKALLPEEFTGLYHSQIKYVRFTPVARVLKKGDGCQMKQVKVGDYVLFPAEFAHFTNNPLYKMYEEQKSALGPQIADFMPPEPYIGKRLDMITTMSFQPDPFRKFHRYDWTISRFFVHEAYARFKVSYEWILQSLGSSI